MASSGVLIEVSSLDAGYGRHVVLSGVDVSARRGEITVIVGPNGSGKSTLLKSVFGLCEIHAGTVTYGGADITRMPPHEIARNGIAYLPQVSNVFTNLSVRENLVMACYTLGSGEARERSEGVFETFPGLETHRSSRAGTLSGGERQMLAMGMALVRRPDVMLFDEPTANLSPKLAGEVIERVVQMRDEFGITVMLVEQNVRRALAVADAVTVLAGGSPVYSGDPAALLEHPEVTRLYLGMEK